MKHAKLYLLTLFVWLTSIAVGQNALVTGTVLDEAGEPMIGVSIRLKNNPAVGASTNAEGKFSINTPSANTVLTISFIGYVTQEVTSRGTTPLTITLIEEQTALNELVVVGYQDMRRKDLTGSVAKASVDDMLKAPVPTFDQALGGRVAGVSVSSSEGRPGGSMNIVIRGNNSVTQDNSPLYVIDGFPVEDPRAGASINPNDIESIDILKDASATAIYGARGANGVIIITTKKGKAGELQIKYDGNFGVQRITHKIPMMNAYEFVRLQSEIWTPSDMTSTGYFQTYNGKTYTLADYADVEQYDWQNLIFRDATQQSHSLSLTGGQPNNRYNASFSYYDQDGIVLKSNYKRLQGRLGTTITRGKLRLNLNVNYSNTTETGNSPSQREVSGMNNLFYSVWGYRPVTQPGTPLAVLLESIQDPNVESNNDYRFNPYLSLKEEHRLANIAYTQFNGFAEYEFIKGLKLKVSGTLTTDVRYAENYNNSRTRYGYAGSKDKINGRVTNSQRYTWLNENILTYQKMYDKKHTINLLGGFTLQESDIKQNSARTIMIPEAYESVGIPGMMYGTSNEVVTGRTQWSLMSFLARANYNYKSKYYLTASFRADGSSKFSRANWFSYYPSLATAWTFTEEPFMAGVKETLNAGKLRLGWGVTGNDRVGEYARLARLVQPYSEGSYSNPLAIGYGNYSFDNVIYRGVIPYNLGNPDLKWETTAQWNAGLDLSLWKNRIDLVIDFYNKTTYDLLINATLNFSSGYGSSFKNVGKVQNRGLEVTLNTVNVKTKDFSWTSNFNIAFNHNKVLELNENQRAIISTEEADRNISGQNYIAKVGYPIGMMYGYIYEGTYKYDDFDVEGGNYVLKPHIARYTSDNNTQPGFPKYRDLNKDGIVDAQDQTFIGRGEPIHIGGFTNNFTYKAFDLSIFFQWSYGANILNLNRLMFETGFNRRKELNQFESYSHRWTDKNPNSDIPSVNGGALNLLNSSRVVEDGSFLRLKTVSLGYTIPHTIIKAIKMQSARVYVSAQNLFTLHNYSGYDPEVSVRDKALTPNMDFSAYPRAASVNVGVNLSL